MTAAAVVPVKHVLIVDDCADVRDLMGEIVRGLGYVVHEASDGAEGLDVLGALGAADEAPSLILLDLMMPLLDGRDFIRRLDERARSIPIVIITASGQKAVAGAREVLAKPVEPERLRDVVRTYLA